MIDPIAYINEPRWQTVSLGLERTSELLDRLGNPQDSLRFIHVAGTNGKGSASAFIASVLQHAGYRVGLFTSPSLLCFEDRIRVNGKNISYESLCKVTEQIKAAAEAMAEHPTEFELLTAVAFTYFKQEQCDIVVAEVGLGGRLDSTNVITTVEASVITPISLDHCAMLGETLPQIAREKAGIIKPQVQVVSAPQEEAVLEVLEAVANENAASFTVVDPSLIERCEGKLSYRGRTGLSLGLLGAFQFVNAATALDVLDVLRSRGWNISEDAIREGLAHVTWPGRFDRVCNDPLILVDGGHNVAGIEALQTALIEDYPDHHVILLTGVLEDKDYRSMAARLVEFADEVITITPPNPRALSAEAYADTLRCLASKAGREMRTIASTSIARGVERALDRSRAVASKDPGAQPLICVCGSLYLISHVMEVLRHMSVLL